MSIALLLVVYPHISVFESEILLPLAISRILRVEPHLVADLPQTKATSILTLLSGPICLMLWPYLEHFRILSLLKVIDRHKCRFNSLGQRRHRVRGEILCSYNLHRRLGSRECEEE